MEWEKEETMRLLQGKPGTLYQESSEEDRAVYRKWLKNLLQVGVTSVTFVKADGTLRTMKATLDPVIIPTPAVPNAPLTESPKGKAVNEDVCKVWDTEAEAWRSFRYDRLKSITVILS